ncbi:nuclear transport factor 2 family protein [Lysobacter koreensis]|uniref:Nuclear transport factor 2 family protein n=1 Tax=Lysobacter koreensis TaxID=266122 RepID=A0ABW2YQW6_9GAMM
MFLIASPALGRENAARIIERDERALAESLGRNDSSVLERIFAQDCVWVLPDGTVLDKAQAIQAMQAGEPYSLLRATAVTVRVFGNVAVAHGEDEWRKGGDRGTFSWTSTWLRRNGKWQIVQVQDTEHRH